jgi:hypothetical protein
MNILAKVIHKSTLHRVTVAMLLSSLSATALVQSCAKVKTAMQASSRTGSTLAVVSGSGQKIEVGGAKSKPLKVSLTDKGAAIEGEPVQFELTSGKTVTLSSTAATTDAKGQAYIDVKSTAVSGDSVVTATYSGQTVEFQITVIDSTQSTVDTSDSSDELLLLAGGGQSTDPNTTFAQPIQVTAMRKGKPVTGERVTFSQVSGSVAIVIANATASTTSTGDASTTVAAGSVTGTATLRATWNKRSIDAILTVSRDEHINIIDGNLQTAAPGQAFTLPLKVQVIRSGASVSGATIAFAQQSGAGVTLSASTATTDASGFAQVTATAGASAGATTVRASYNGQSIDFTITTIAQSSTTIGYVSGNGQSGAPASTAASNLVVEVRNSTTNALMDNVLVRFTVTTNSGKVAGTLTTVDVSTNSMGQASTTFKFGTVAGANAIEAKIVGNPTQIYNFSATTTVSASATVDLSTSTLTSLVSSLTANGVSQTTVKFTARDTYGNQIPTNSGTVVFTPTAGTMTGSVTNNADGTWTQNIIAPSSNSSGSLTVTATYNAAALTSSPLTITLVAGSIVPSASTISVDQSSITADGTSTATVTVSLRDANSNIVGSGGQTVVITTTAGTLLGSVVDVGNGTYSQVIRSSTIAQTASISATVGGIAVGSGPAYAYLIFAPGAFSLANSTLQVSPSTIVPNGTSTTTVTVTLRDANGNQLSTGGRTVTISSTAGTWNTAVVDNSNGTYQKVLKSANSESTATVSATVDGSAMSSTVKVYMTNGTSGPSILTSLVEIIGGTTKIAADGTTTATVRVTLKDSTSTQLTAGGSTVAISATAGTMLGSVLDNSNGTYTQLIRAPNSSAIATITATVDGQNINSSTSLQFYGSFSVANSTLAAYPPSVVANGTSQSLIVIQARDTSNIDIPVGGATGLALATTAGTLAGSLVDNSNGTYTQYITAPGSAATATVSATQSGTPLTSTTTITFFASNNLAGLTIDCANIATYTGQNIMVDNGTLTMNSYGSAASGANCSASFTFGAIILTNSGVITHSATTATGASTGQEYRLEFTATSLSIDGTSRIDVNGKGYIHHSSDTAATYRVQTNIQNATFPNYGSIFYPNDLGPSGSMWGSGFLGSAGGGQLKITISNGGQLINNGSIRANGYGYSSNQGSSGSGGSILINTGSLSGSGTITAHGGNNSSGSSPVSGSGGRIAIYYTSASGNFSGSSNIINSVQACGGTNPSAGYDGRAGTVFMKSASQTYGDLIINNCSRNTSLNSNKTTLAAPANSTPSTLSASTLTKPSGFSDIYDTSKNPYIGYYINPNISQNATATKNDDIAYLITSGDANSVSITTGNMTSIADSSKTFQFMLIFDNIEIAGRASVYSIAPVISKNGDLSSNDNYTVNHIGLPPSEIEWPGATSISIDGTNAYNSGNNISLTSFSSANLTFKNATLTTTGAITAGSMTLDGAIFVPTCLKDTTCLNLSGSLTLQNSATLYQKATTSTSEYALNIVAASLSLASGSTISANSRGYSYTGPTPLYYTTLGNIQAGTSTTYNGGGGSHGGRGGTSVIAPYGSYYSPNSSGSSGITYSGGNLPTAGGGIVRISLNNGNADISGSIDVSSSTASNNAGGGAGGSIYISAGTISGSGTLKANGGASAQGGGSGGRIAVHYTSATGGFSLPTNIQSRIQNFGGAGAYNGAAGTTFFKSATQTYGDLYINNNNQVPSISSVNSYTSLNIPAQAMNTTLTSSTLSSTGSFSEQSLVTNHLLGMSVNPNISQNSTSTYNDDQAFLISGQTANDITIASGDMTTVGTTGSTYQVMLILDNLEVSGKGVLSASGPVLVKNGDLSSNSTDTITVNGGLVSTVSTAGYEFPGITTGTFNAQASSINFNVISGSGTYTFQNGTFSSLPITLASLTLDAATYTPKCTKSETCITASSGITLQNTSVLYQAATTATTEYALVISTVNLNLNTGSSISAGGRGYTYYGSLGVSGNYQTIGNVTASGTAGMGGSHGGRGAQTSATSVYGSITNPFTSGSSGSTNAGWAVGSGGGIIRITGTGTVDIAGTISASANAVATNAASGSGGSVYINADTLSGSGTIRANGGDNSNNSFAGGGGRIAVYYTTASGGFAYPTNILSRVQAYGGTSGLYSGNAGTIYLKGSTQTYGDLYINNNNIANPYGVTLINMPARAASGSLTATTLTLTNAFLEQGYQTNYLQGFSVNPNVGQNATANYADDTAYLISSHNADTLTISSGNMTSIASTGNTFQVMLILDNLEISGKASVSTTGPILALNGDISSNTTNTAVMSGSVATSGSYGGVEFGGTIASMTMDAGGSTTTLTPVSTTGNLSLQNGTFVGTTINVGGNLDISNSATVYAGTTNSSQNVIVTGDLTLSGSSSLKSNITTNTAEYRLNVTAANITIASGSSLNALNAGYGMYTAYANRVYGNIDYANSGLNGGSYGGQGGQFSGTANTAYGSFSQPTDLGASGSNYTVPSTNKLNGGGAIKLTATGTLTVDGTLHANSSNGCSTSYNAGGAGGSVWITTGTLTGSGTISANGSPCQYGAGSGGRVAVYYTTRSGGFSGATVYNTITAFGGVVASITTGAAGTVYLKDAASSYGDLIINNAGSTTTYGLTYIPIPSLSTSSSLTATTLTSAAFGNTFGGLNWYKGMFINPNTAQNGTVSLMDDSFFEIGSNTSSAVTTTSGDMTTVGATGNTFKGALYLDNLEIRGKGKLDFSGQQIVARYGDLSSNDTTSFVLDGTLNVGIIDVNAATWSTTANAAGTITTKCAANFACP